MFGVIITRHDLGHQTQGVKNRLYGLLLALLKAVSLSGITVTRVLRKLKRVMMEASGRLKNKLNTKKGNRN